MMCVCTDLRLTRGGADACTYIIPVLCDGPGGGTVVLQVQALEREMAGLREAQQDYVEEVRCLLMGS